MSFKLSEFYKETKEEEESPLARDSRLDREEKARYPQRWEKTLQISKENAYGMMQRLPALERALGNDSRLKLSVAVNGDGTEFSVSAAAGEVDHNTLEALQLFIGDCGEIRIAGSFYGLGADECVRFAGLFAGSGTHTFSPGDLSKLLREALMSAEEIEYGRRAA